MSIEEIIEERLRAVLADELGRRLPADREPAAVAVYAPRPLWADFEALRGLFTKLSRRRLNEYVAAMRVRKRKQGAAGGTGAAEYSVEDLDRVYDEDALGKRAKRLK